MELGYLTSDGSWVLVDSFGWRTLFPGFRFLPGEAKAFALNRILSFQRRSDVVIVARLHRRGWGHRGETILRRTQATWFHADGLDLFLAPTARSIRVPWRGELARVRRPFFALEAPVQGLLEVAKPQGNEPCLVRLDPATVRHWRRSGVLVEVSALERKELSDFVIGNVSASIEFSSEAEATAFTSGLPAPRTWPDPAEKDAPHISRSKWIVRTPKILALMLASAVILGLVSIAAALAALAGEYDKSIQALAGSLSGIALLSWVLPLLLRTRRREFIDLVDAWPRALWQRTGADHRGESARAAADLRTMGVTIQPGTSSLVPVDALLRSFPPAWFSGTFAFRLSLLTVDRIAFLAGMDVKSWWEYVLDRRECAFRIDAASLRLYPLTAVLAVWQMRDPEGLEQFAQTCARELQMRLAFRLSLPAFVALGFTASGWEAFSKFWPRVDGQLGHSHDSRAPPGVAIRERLLTCGAVNLRLLEEPSLGEPSRMVPTFAYPSVSDPVRVITRVEPLESSEERLARIPIQGLGRPMLVRIAPYAHDFVSVSGARQVELSGVVESGYYLGESPVESPVTLGDPADSSVAGPEVGLTQVNAQVFDVAEEKNTFTGLPMWRLVLDLGGLRLPVVARGDMWITPPQTGRIFVGRIWLFAQCAAPS